MAPIRVGLVGLSASAKTAWASKAHLPYLLSERGRARYEIVALLNSSEAGARWAWHVHSKTTYTHDAAAAAGGRTMVGVQGRVSPPVLKVQELLWQGRIGKVLSSEVLASGGLNSRDSVPAGLSYFTDRAVGGNIYTIGFGHLYDQINHVLGHIQNPHAQLQIQRPQVKIINPADQTSSSATTNVPDLIIVTGRVPGPSDIIGDGGATVLHRFRLGTPFPGEVPLRWTINGEKGEVRLTARAGATLHASAYDLADQQDNGVTIEVHNFATDSLEKVEWSWGDWKDGLPLLARSVAELYERFADGREVPTFADALRSQEQLEEMLASGGLQ
ncbi:hypothetical protein MAPG_04708 [Magnaporthiopsis poae ATCC 64411]|uniref:Gal80p-like C-terminal domain-containing protein n=1 Tax=Magnaporthiopsis poae (strain ATCC 64411 / 73-15) TaxID=644358 RepID=A0A0C4DXF5_MAGP6|nr:hypothetical protein MAPG_04708 [Magnaporthiopsis poae ATCC 64411]